MATSALGRDSTQGMVRAGNAQGQHAPPIHRDA